jgi:hypothetical protein
LIVLTFIEIINSALMHYAANSVWCEFA